MRIIDESSRRSKPSSNGKCITLTELAEHKALAADYLEQLGLHDLTDGSGVGIPYFDTTGKQVALKRRTRLVAKEGSWWPKGVPLRAYGEWRLDEAHKERLLFVVEGESDCWALWFHGLPALGIPGANAAKTLTEEHIECLDAICLIREPGQSGESFIPGMTRRLGELGFAGKALELRCPAGLKDPADLHKQAPDRFLALMEQATDEARQLEIPHPAGPRQSGNGKGEQTKRSVRELQPYQPFPVDALPKPLAEFVQQGALSLGCDPAFVALPAWAVLGSVIGNSRSIRLKRTWWEPPVFWCAIVGDSGTLKSPAWTMCLSPLFALDAERRAQFKCAKAAYNEQLQQHKEKKKAYAEEKRKGTGLDPGDPPEAPVLQRLVCCDITIETVAELLEDNPRGLLATRDELAAWLNSFTRYKGRAGGSDLPNWLEMHRAGPVCVDRKTGDRRSIFVQRAAVSVTGGIQPGTLARALTQEFLDAGLGARLLLAMPPKKAKRWTDAEIEPTVEQEYHRLVEALLKLEMEKDSSGQPRPFGIRMTPEAKAVWVRFYNEWGQEQAQAEGEMAAAYSKLEAYAARFALLHHVVSHVMAQTDDCDPMEAQSIEAGIRLCRWFAAEAVRIYTMLSESEEERAARRLVEFIEARGGRLTPRALMRANSRRFPTSAAAELALDELVSMGLADWTEESASNQGGRPSRVLVLRPTHDKTDKTPTASDSKTAEAHDTGAGSESSTP
jgi:hypothetical protein